MQIASVVQDQPNEYFGALLVIQTWMQAAPHDFQREPFLCRRISDALSLIGASLRVCLPLISYVKGQKSEQNAPRFMCVQTMRSRLAKAREVPLVRMPIVPSPLKSFVAFPCDQFVSALNKVLMK